MLTYRKRPITVNAYQITNDDIDKIKANKFGYVESWPKWFRVAVREKVIYENVNGVHIMTLEGSSYTITEGYWIIRGEKGELWPVRDDVFHDEYEQI